MGYPQIMLIGGKQQSDKLEICRQGRQPSRAQNMCNRFCPAPLGIVLWCSKLEFDVSSERVIPNQFSFLVWESPSNSRQPIVIQPVLSYRFPEFIHEKLYSYSGDCHASVRYFIAMTEHSMARQISNLLFPRRIRSQ